MPPFIENVPVKKSKSVDKPTVAIIGPGRLGIALALALVSRGYRLLALVGRTAPKRQLAKRLGDSTLALSANELSKLPRCELILVATPDDAIADTAVALSQSASLSAGVTVLHTSGAFSSSLLSTLADRGVHTGSIHPLVSVSDPYTGTDSLRGAYYCVEGDRTALRLARSIVRDLGGRSFSIPSNKKALYHAAAVTSSGHVTALFDIAIEMLATCGLTKADAKKILLPLLRSAVSNLQGSSPAKALTGTFARGDVRTATEHIAALSDERLPDARAAYKLLGERSLALASRRGRMDLAIVKQLRLALSKLEDQ